MGLAQIEYIVGRLTPDNLFPADQLSSSGLANPDLRPRGLHSVVGGTGRYFAARGEVFISNRGFNNTGFPNLFVDFRLEKRDE